MQRGFTITSSAINVNAFCSPLELSNNVVDLDQAAAGPLHGNDRVGYPVRVKTVDLKKAKRTWIARQWEHIRNSS